MITLEEQKILRAKQIELGLSDEQCSMVIEFLKIGLNFSDAEVEFETFILNYLDRKHDKKIEVA